MMKMPLNALILEDCEDDALLVVRELGRQGFDVSWDRAWTASGMKSMLESEACDVVLSDYSMPGFDAPAALKSLNDTGLDLPFIVISGTIGEDVAVETMKAGAHDYLLKGNLARLGQAIERELGDARIRREHRLGIEKIEHLNRVLRAIRNINKLIVQEKDPVRLVEKTCDSLIETRGYMGALIVRTDRTGKLCSATHRVFGGGSTLESENAILQKGLTPCMQQALRSTDPVVVDGDWSECGDCSLHSLHCGRQRLVQALVHDEKRYGVLGITFPREVNLDADELDLVNEVVGDVAFALHGIELNAALSAEHDRHRMLLRNLPGMAYRGRSDWMSELLINVELVSGYTSREVDRLEDGWLTIVHPDDRSRLIENSRSLGVQPRSMAREYRIIDKSGQVRFVIDYATSAFDPNGALVGFDGIVFDITEHKNMQIQIAQSDRLATIGMLAAGVAHEINNPLCYILGNLESLTEDLPTLSTAMRPHLDPLSTSMLDDVTTRIDETLQGAQRIKDIARGLGVFSRVEQNRLVTVDLRDVIEVAINTVSNEIKYRARLVKEFGKTSSVMANDGKLSQVFLNLLVNATHAIQEGDVDGNEIGVRTWQEGDEVFAEVSDTGKGISDQHLPQLFEPFFTTKEIGIGTGLGLSISRSIIEDHGGHIDVKSRVGKGTSFVVRLPIGIAEDLDQVDAPDQAVAQLGVRGRILVVDDEAPIRAVVTRILRDHDVVEADSGEEACKILEADQAFDLVLCDMMMPWMSGLELHEWLSTTNPDLARRVVFITGGAFTPKARDYLTKISNVQIEKPFEMRSLKKIVAELIATYQEE